MTEVDQNSTDEQYPTAKLLYDLYAALGALIDALDEGKQDMISDLAAIRSGAALGATALQAITAAAGSDIGTVGTPSVTVSTSGSSTTLTFHQLKGAKGDPGTNGTNGATWYTGTAVTGTNSSGISASVSGSKAGDFYLNTSWNVYKATAANTWGYVGNIKGATGPAGSNATVTVDSALSDSSTNPVQNKVVKAALDGKASSSHTHSYLPLSGGTMTGNILGNATAALGTTAKPFHQLVLGGATSATMSASTTNPRITFVEGTGTQPVHLVYTDYDSYRSPAGLKVVGNSSASSSPAWFEVEGIIYAAGQKISDQNITGAKTVMTVSATATNAAAQNNTSIHALVVELTCPGTPPTSTGASAIYASAKFGYAGYFSGAVKVSSSFTANSVSAATVYQTSDDRLKDYLGDFHFDLADLDRIPLRLFRFKDDKEQRTLIGTSAQAVQKVLPEIVGSSRTASEEDNEEYLNVDYSKLALVALDCVRQLRDEVATLKAEMAAMRTEIEELKSGR